MKSLRNLLIAGLLLNIQFMSHSQVPPALSAKPVALPSQFAEVSWIAFDDEGTLWALDRPSAKLTALDYSMKPIRSFGKAGTGKDLLQEPTCFSIDSGRAAVADEGVFKIFSLKDGKPLGVLSSLSQDGALTVPASGFLLLPKTLLLIGQTFVDSQPMDSGAVKISTLASISLKDKGWAFMRSEDVSADERPALFLFARGLGTYWPEERVWALTQKLPRQVVLVDKDGRAVRTSEASPAKLPSLAPMESPQQQMDTLLKEKYVVALLPAGSRLAIIWHIPAGNSPRYEIEWMGKDLKPQGTTRLEFPVKFTPEDILYSATADAKGRALILFIRRPLGGTSSSALFSVELGRQ